MTRKEGFIDVEKILKEMGVDTTSLETVLESPLVTEISKYPFNAIFSFEYENETYFYKHNSDIPPYSELIASSLLEDFGLPCIEYDLAILGSIKGVLSKNFKKEDVIYLNGEDILNDFWKQYGADIENYNNLEGIWDALEYRYQNFPNKREIVEKLMKRIVEIFLFDIICGNKDRHSLNWCIAESEEGIDIGPIFDNEMILSESVYLTMNENRHQNLWDALKDFLKVSSDEFKNIIISKMWIISDKNIKSVLKRIEDKTGYPLPKDIKDHYLQAFKNHRNKLENLLEENNKEREEQYEGKNR